MTEVQEGFRYMQKGQHIGKIVVDMALETEGRISPRPVLVCLDSTLNVRTCSLVVWVV